MSGDAAGVTVGGAVVEDVKLNGDAVAVGAGLVDTNWKLGPAGTDGCVCCMPVNGCVCCMPADGCVPVATDDALGFLAPSADKTAGADVNTGVSECV